MDFNVKNIFIFALLCVSNPVFCSDTISTFSFSIGTHTFSPTGDFFIGAATALPDNSFAVAQAGPNDTKFRPLTPPKVTVNNKQGADNPLFGQAISLMSIFGKELAVVPANNNKNIFVIRASTSILSTRQDLHDAAGNPTQGIVGLTQGPDSLIIAVVSPQGGSFGNINGGIALVRESEEILSLDEKRTKKPVLQIINGNTGRVGNKAVTLDTTAAVVKINSDLAAMATAVDIVWDGRLQRAYIALQVTAGLDANDGARAIVAAQFAKSKTGFKLVLEPIAPDAVFQGLDKIVGATGAGAHIALRFVRVLHTTTGLSYLVVANDANQVFALPLVNQQSNSALGLLADNTVDPQQQVNQAGVFVSRFLGTPLTDPAHALTTASQPAVVGVMPLPIMAGKFITDLFVRPDAVYATVGDTYDGTTEPGLYFSQAIFDATGKIAAWTPWARASGSTSQLFGAAYDIERSQFWLLSGIDAAQVYRVGRTRWGALPKDGLLGGTYDDESVGLVAGLSAYFAKVTGGIQAFFDYARTTPGLAVNEHRISLFIATGAGKIALIQSGADVAPGIFKPTQGDFWTNSVPFNKGMIETTFPVGGPVRVVTIQGGALEDIGVITASAVASNGTNGWLFVGGVHGLAVLAHTNGDGWVTAGGLGLQTGFGGLEQGMAFNKIGNLSLIRKLISDGSFLYILTDNALYKIALDAANFANAAQIDPIIIATIQDLGLDGNGNFTDLIISKSLALLGTSNGLFRNGNGTDVRMQTGQNLRWVNVCVPESAGMPVTHLVALSPDGFEQGVARNGQLLALSSLAGFDLAQVNRFFIADVVISGISDRTIMPLPDIFIKNCPSFFIHFGEFRSTIATDGSLLYTTRNSNGCCDPYLLFVPLIGRHPNVALSKIISLGLSQAHTINPLVHSTATGSWLVSGDFGLRVNE